MTLKGIATIFAATVAMYCCGDVCAQQNREYDVFIPIAKYIRLGDADKLSAWFDDNLEIAILSKTGDYSRSQARQIMKSFFDSYAPRDFDITHTAGRANMKYAMGRLTAGGGVFEIAIFVTIKGNGHKIQQLKIVREE